MKKIYFLGILVAYLLLITSCASAAYTSGVGISPQYVGQTYTLNYDDSWENALHLTSFNYYTVTATILSTTATATNPGTTSVVRFKVVPKIQSSNPQPSAAYFKVIALPTSIHVSHDVTTNAIASGQISGDPSSNGIDGNPATSDYSIPTYDVTYKENANLDGLSIPADSNNKIIFNDANFGGFANANTQDFLDTVDVTVYCNPGFQDTQSLTNMFGAHIAWPDSFPAAGSVMVAGISKTPTKNVPEFPSIALPVAAVLGLLFISQRKRKEE